MDTIQTVTQKGHGQSIQRFVLSGASKRGWTTWLTGAADQRVAGIAPMVIDMLNMKKQLAWECPQYGQKTGGSNCINWLD
jgi:PhoPQ-activated pathogenicity-related protein